VTALAPAELSVSRGAHPLEPLSAEEIAAVSALLKRERGLSDAVRFVFVTLAEPPKPEVLRWAPGDAPLPREAFVVLRDRDRRLTCEAVVSLTDGAVRSWKELPGVQAPIMAEEFFACEETVRADPRWQEAMRKRGITDFTLAMIDPWASSYTGPQDDPAERRIARPLTWIRTAPNENGYARPIEGLLVVVDLDEMAVVDVEDHGVVELPTHPGNYEPEFLDDPGNVPPTPVIRDDVRTIDITQPDGPSFTVDGHEVSWQKWKLRLGFTPREGLVLHQIGYQDGDRLRSVIYRASLAEMYVPYGDPAPTHRFKNVFDQGEYGVGWLANSLTLGCDCVGHIQYFDGVVNDQDGQPVVIPNAICMHEEDDGIAWKHTDFRTNAVQVRRRRRLVISSIVTVGNYEYGFFWYLYNDGSIEYQIKLTGIISTGAIASGEQPAHGVLVAPGLYGPHHQHFFCIRMDMAVDGPGNSVVEVDSVPSPLGPGNPGNAWTTQRTVFASESQAQRPIDPLKGRFWRIENPSQVSALGSPTAYKLMPGENVAPMFAPDSLFAARAGFTSAHLWVTAYDPAQNFAAGDYPNQSPGGQGLPAYATGDRPIEDADVVVWYTFGAHHVVRPEDWPVMPVSTAGFHLKPSGFFAGNPALDLPASEPAGHCCAD
jgi:primary-amine oxidase